MQNVFINYNKPSTLDKTFAAINQMVEDGVIESYALGGAVAVMFYIEPDTTFDIDIFCVVKGVDGASLDPLRPIVDYLKQRNTYLTNEDGFMIEGFRVQFFPLPTSDELFTEAVAEANTLPYLGVPVRVMSPEHLIAIMLKVGRAKDDARVSRFIEAGAFDPEKLDVILSRYNIDDKRKKLKRIQKGLGL